MSSSSSPPVTQEASTYDEHCMHQSMMFSDSLKDLENLRAQLYSAAEYFELSYTNDDQKEMIVKTLKDYAVRALVNTVDHLGSVTYKVNGLVDEQADEVSGTELQVSCIGQRLRTCQEHINHQGISQQSLVITTPKYHKRYILPVGKSMDGAGNDRLNCQEFSREDGDDWHVLRKALRSTMVGKHSHSVKIGRSPSPPTRQKPFTFTEKRSVSPLQRLISPLQQSISPLQRSVSPFPRTVSSFQRSLSPFQRSVSPSPRSISPLPSFHPLARSGSLASRSTSPNPVNAVRQYPSATQKSASVKIRAEKDGQIEPQPSKSKRLLKALLSRRKTKDDPMLYSYLDEY